jgi:hypothetical protein
MRSDDSPTHGLARGQLCVPWLSEDSKKDMQSFQWGSNPRPYAYEAHALPTTLLRRMAASVHTTAPRVHPLGKHVAGAIAIPLRTRDLATPCVASPRVSPNSWHTVPKHAGSNTGALHRTVENRLRGDLAPAGKAQWRGFEPPRAQPDGSPVHHRNHSVTMPLPPEHNYPQQASQAPTIAKAADRCSRRVVHPMRGIMSACTPIANSHECQLRG